MSIITFATEHYDDIIAIGGLAYGLLLQRSRKKLLDDLWDTAAKLGKQVLPRLLDDTRLTDDAWVLSQITEGIWAGLDRLGVKRSKPIEKIVAEVAEHVKADFADAVIQKLLSGYIKTSEKTLGTLKEATS